MSRPQKPKVQGPPALQLIQTAAWEIRAKTWESGEYFVLPLSAEQNVEANLLVRAHNAALTLRCPPRPLQLDDVLEEAEFACLVDSDYTALEVVFQIGGLEIACAEGYQQVAQRLGRIALNRRELPQRLRRPISVHRRT